MKPSFFLLATGIAVLTAAAPSQSANEAAMEAQVKRINDEWAHIRYQVADRNVQYAQLDTLAEEAAKVALRYPGRAEPLLWEGIVVSVEAARAGILKQLGLATKARDILIRAYSIDPKVADGGAAMSLGVLYYRVPGFPIGFGSAKRARTFFQQALLQDPAGMDNNFFYADFLAQEGDKAQAKRFLARALLAPVNRERPVWDAGRRAEIRSLQSRLGGG